VVLSSGTCFLHQVLRPPSSLLCFLFLFFSFLISSHSHHNICKLSHKLTTDSLLHSLVVLQHQLIQPNHSHKIHSLHRFHRFNHSTIHRFVTGTTRINDSQEHESKFTRTQIEKTYTGRGRCAAPGPPLLVHRPGRWPPPSRGGRGAPRAAQVATPRPRSRTGAPSWRLTGRRARFEAPVGRASRCTVGPHVTEVAPVPVRLPPMPGRPPAAPANTSRERR
jgi:hypothetical protein